MGYAVQQNQTAQPLMFRMVDSADHVTPKTGLSPTVTLSKNGGSFASPSGAVAEVGSGWYKVAGNATDENTLGPLALHATGTGADAADDMFQVVSYDPQDAVRLGLTALPNANAGAAGGLLTCTSANVLPSGAIAAASFASGAVDAAALATDAAQEIRNAVTGGAYALSTDANGRIRIVDGTGTGEINTNSGAVALVDLVTDITTKTGFRLSATGVDDIWDEAIAGHLTAGSTGEALDSAGGAGLTVADIMEYSIDGYEFQSVVAFIAATAVAKVSGGGTGVESFRDLSDSATRVVSTTDNAGNRTSVTLTAI